MSYKKTILTGTLLLTISGFLSRILGFYNRIFLADLIGARELGIYSLIFPIYALCFTLICHGAETGVSNMTSRYLSCKQEKNAIKLLRYVSIIMISFSLFLALLLYISSGFICRYLLKNASCAKALQISSLALPFAALKSCIHGYYLGSGKSSVAAASQLIEQISRVGGICFLSITLFTRQADASLAIWGMVIGEALSCIYSILACLFTAGRNKISKRTFSGRGRISEKKENIIPAKTMLNEFFSFSIPLTINHFSLTLVSSLEAVLIPLVLTGYYGSQDLALESYGTLTGMAFPFLFFPATITNSLSVMLLPAISASYKQKKMVQIRYTISKSLHYCIVLGIFSSFVFLFYGNMLGEVIFHSRTAGQYIYTFAAICPFMYAASTIMSMLNGFGYTRKTMYHSLLCVTVRIACIFLFIPSAGIKGYLYGMIAGFILQLLLDLFSLLQITFFDFSVEKTFLFPTALALSAGWLSQNACRYLSQTTTWPPLINMGISGLGYSLVFALAILFISVKS